MDAARDHVTLGAVTPENPGIATLLDARAEFLRFVESRIGDHAAAEDLLQQTFVRSLQKLDQLRDDESVIAWFYRMLRNAIVDEHRRGGARARALASIGAEAELASEPTPEDRATLCRCVAALIDTLEPSYATALRRVELDGVAVKDFAAEADITANNAGVRVFRARQALRKQVIASCGSCAAHGCVDCCCHGNTDAPHAC